MALSANLIRHHSGGRDRTHSCHRVPRRARRVADVRGRLQPACHDACPAENDGNGSSGIGGGGAITDSCLAIAHEVHQHLVRIALYRGRTVRSVSCK
jgi:hypothetical protein